MTKQIDDEQFYFIQGCLGRALEEIERAYTVLYGSEKPSIPGKVENVKVNTPGKAYAPQPPKVTKGHQQSVNKIDPEKVKDKIAEEIQSKINLKEMISKEVLVKSAQVNQGRYFAMVFDKATNQEASIEISAFDYDELKDSNGTAIIELTEEEIAQAEWEVVRVACEGTCNCNGVIPEFNPYNDIKVSVEMLTKHSRTCTFWDRHTLVLNEQEGSEEMFSQADLALETDHGFELFLENYEDKLPKLIAAGEINGR